MGRRHPDTRRQLRFAEYATSVGRYRVTRAGLIVALVLVASVLAPPVAAQSGGTAHIEHEGEALVLEAAPNQTISGTSDRSPGTKITVRLRSADAATPFLKSRQVTVDGNGGFAAQFDLSGVEPPVSFTAVVYDENGTAVSDKVDGRVVEPGTPVGTTSIATRSITAVDHGKTAELNVSLPTGSSAAVTIGNESAESYATTVQVTDRTEDGTVVLRFDTAAAGRPEPTVSVAGDDGYEILRPEPTLDDGMAPGEYDLAIAEDLNSDPVFIGRFVVQNGTATEGTTAAGTETPEMHDVGTDNWWAESIPGVAGAIALVSGLTALRLYGR